MILKAIYSLILVSLLGILSSEYSEPNLDILSDEILIDLTNEYHSGLSDLNHSIINLENVTNAYVSGDGDIGKVRESVLQTRLDFKKIEFLIEYMDHEAVKRFLNGPPLPSMEPAVSEIVIWAPSGLQTIDEVAFGDEVSEDKEHLYTLVKELKRNYAPIYTYQQNVNLQHRGIFESVRDQLIRIYTLGVTGFDTPGSVAALPESMVALISVKDALSKYEELLKARNSSKVFKETIDLLDQSITYVSDNNDFDSFDRMAFLKEYVNPLLASVHAFHLASGAETIDDVISVPFAVNYDETNLFSEDFLNRFYYSGVHKSEFSEDRVNLGRMLFFDPILSSDNTLACASCHNPEKAFTDGQKKSLARGGHSHLNRNAPTLIDAVFAADFFYDLREADLLRQIKHVVTDSSEFNTSFIEIENKLSLSSEYVDLFEDAYGEYGKYKLTKFSISHALASYVLTLSSFNSDVDKYIRNEMDGLDQEIIDGYNLFMGKAACGSCHFAPVFNGLVPPYFTESESEVLGVPSTKDTINPIVDLDIGRRGSYRPIDEADHFYFSFKTPTVRNSALTVPYMHNGVYDSLDEVVDFYNKGGGLGLGIELEHQTLPFAQLNLTKTEQRAIVRFMEALTDTTGTTAVPSELPAFENAPELNSRSIGGVY